ncbi:MAG: hypothetical protein Q9218_007917 [Villophora microphyllina]
MRLETCLLALFVYAAAAMHTLITNHHVLDADGKRKFVTAAAAPGPGFQLELRSVSKHRLRQIRAVTITQGITDTFSFGNQWLLHLKFQHAIQPEQIAASELGNFYDKLLERVETAMINSDPLLSLVFRVGRIVFEMRCRNRNPQTTLSTAARGLVFLLQSYLENGLVGTFHGEAVCDWDHSISVFIALRIDGIA